MDRGAKPAKAKVIAKPPVVRPSRTNDGAGKRGLQQRLTEALAQQTAISEILRVISASPTAVQPVLDAVAERAAHLCHAPFARVFLGNGDVLRSMAHYSVDGEPPVRVTAMPLKRTSITGRAAVDGKTIHHEDVVPLLVSEYPDARENALRQGLRAVLAVPLMREGGAYGAIFLWRREPGRFAPDQVALVETFARQVAIAIDNVRLFKETKEALEQQTATSEILRVISRSPTDAQPVFETMAANALRLCDATFSSIYRFDGELIHLVAHHNVTPEGTAAFRSAYPCRPSRGGATQRSILTRSIVHIPDIREDPEYVYQDAAQKADYRSALSVPMLRDGQPIGTITVYRDVPRPFPDTQVELLKTFADQAVIAIENVRLFTELQARNRDLTVALDQQTATSEILRVISSSQTDVQPVFDAIVRSAVRLCGADHSIAARFDGELLHPLAYHGFSPEALEIIARTFPMRPSPENMLGRATLKRAVDNLPDMLADPEYSRDFALAGGWRSGLGVPMFRDGVLIGAIAVSRTAPGAFPDHLVALLKTFADQAVIAIENVRLFNETKEALDQQTATSEILRVIASSPGDIKPVLETVVRAAAQFCGAANVLVLRLVDGALRGAAAVGPFAEVLARRAGSIEAIEIPVTKESVSGRAALECRTIHIHDLAAEREDEFPVGRELQRQFGHRTILATPLLREGVPLGVIGLFRTEVKPFSDKQVALLKTFADQAVIAIENVRLFKELEARNRDLTDALEQQTATGEVLKVISRSAFDLQPVLDTVIESAVRLCGAEHGHVHRFDGELLRLAAGYSGVPEMLEYLREHPAPLGPGTISGIAGLERRPVHCHDVLAQSGYQRGDAQKLGGFRTVLAIPMLSAEALLGVIMIWKTRVEPFTDKQIALVTTFADQAVIAIENVRLFTELEIRNHDLTEALEQQTATSEILRVISRSQTDVQPVFESIAAAALKLCGASSSNVVTFDGELIHLAALANLTPEGADAMRQLFPRPPSRDIGSTRAIQTGRVVAIPDVLDDPEYALPASAVAGRFRSVLAVPLLREGSPIGAIGVGRPERGPFPDKQVALLLTFADQAVIAIENVRLFTELEARNRALSEALQQQTATSDILRVISQSQRDVQPVFDTIAAAALKLCDASSANVFTFDGELIQLAALVNVNPTYGEELRRFFPRPPSRDTAVTRAILTCSVVAIPDVVEDRDYAIGAQSLAGGFRSVLAVPLVRDGVPIGGIAVGRPEPGPFPDQQIALLQTFADQAVIAIENVRLFTELEARTTQLTRSVGELKALGEVGQAVSSTLDLATVLSTIVSRATQLAGMDGGAIYEYDEAREVFYLHTTDRLPDELVEALRSTPIRKGEGAIGQLAVTGEPVEIRDIMDEGIYQSRVRKILIGLGYRSLLAVPLLREDHLLGGLAVNRTSAGAFAPHVIDLLKTFATQSALAIQNARLFREIEDKGRQLETASRHKSEFLANMSHELRTPLNAIIGFSEVLSERMFGEVNDKQAEYLGDILESGRHLLSLINDILDLSKIEAGRMELEPTDFNLPGAIENTLTLVRERAHRRGITLERTVDERLGMICGDERKVKQVLLNLLSNALKFTPEGGRINVRAEVQDSAAEISVRDTGVGIAPEDQEAVFEEFRQVGTAAKKVEGTGLGLAIARKFIELHGGRIWVKSQVGMGSTFTFTLPLR